MENSLPKDVEEKIRDYVSKHEDAKLSNIVFGYSLSQSTIQELCGVLEIIKAYKTKPKTVSNLVDEALQKHLKVKQ